MLPRTYREGDVEAALADAGTFQQEAKKDDADDEQEKAPNGDAVNRCRNPFCRNVLCNSYARYCEDRGLCQLYRALRLQCLANAEAAAVQEMNSSGRSDSFLIVSTVEAKRDAHTGSEEGESEEQKNTEAVTPFVIPRRKLPSTISTSGAAVSHDNRSTELLPPRGMTVRDNSSANSWGSRKRPRLGPRMHFNEVLAHFEPRVPTTPGLAVSSQMSARRLQQAARRPQPRRTIRNSGVKLGGENDGNRSSLRGLARMSRLAYKSLPLTTETSSAGAGRIAEPQAFPSRLPEACNQPSQAASSLPSFPPRPQDISLMGAIPYSTLGEHARESRPTCERCQSRSYNNSRWVHPRFSQEHHQPGYERTSEVNYVPYPHFVPPPAYSNGYSEYCSDSERTNVASFSTSVGKGEDSRGSGSCDGRFRALRPRYDDKENRVSCRDIHGIGDTIERSYDVHQVEPRNSSLVANSLPFTCENRSSDDATYGYESEESSMDLSVEQPLYRQQNASTDVSEKLPPVTASRPSRIMGPAYLTRGIEAADTEQSASNDTDMDSEPSFSSHDPFIQHVLSQFIQDLPNELKPVVNFTIKPRKMRWYIQCSKKIERASKPHVHVQMQSNRVAMMVENRVWLKLKGPSTAALLQNAIKAMRDEAISWRDCKSEVEQCLELYRTRQGDDVDLTNVFLRGWNNLKERGINCSLPRGTNYFCGARLHHWSFVVGRVEIASGSHEDKREVFRLAAASAAECLLGLGDGQNGRRWRPPPRDTSSDASDDCEFLFVRDVNDDESVVLAATAAAITLRDSPDSATNDVSGPLPAVGDNDAIQMESTRQVDESAIIVISSDSEDEDPPGHAATTTIEPSSLVRASSAPSTASEPTEVATKRYCKLCEIIRMRKLDSAGCRQCQLAIKQTKTEAVEVRARTREDKAVRTGTSALLCSELDDTCPARSAPLSAAAAEVLPLDTSRAQSTVADTEAASRSAKRIRRFYEMLRMSG